MSKNKFFITIIVLLVAIIGLSATCPDERDHKEKIKSVFSSAINKKIGTSDNLLDLGLKSLGKMALKEGADFAISHMVEVEDYYIVSIGRIEFDGKEQIVSVGAVNHIFTASDEDIVREIEKHIP